MNHVRITWHFYASLIEKYACNQDRKKNVIRTEKNNEFDEEAINSKRKIQDHSNVDYAEQRILG